jgi:hypothetical protein
MAIGFSRMAFPLAGLFLFCGMSGTAVPDPTASRITRAAADRCDAKLKILESYASHRRTGGGQKTQFSEDEVNAYLALDLSSKYHPCLKSLTVTFEEDRLQGVAMIDFNRLGKGSTKVLPKLLSIIFSGVHAIKARGRLVSGNGKAYFRLEEARFDNTALPKTLVEGIITAVARKQNPPFDPLQPSKLFYGIQKADFHPGYILVYQ